jgi:uncharacterized caspase-like protein
MEIVKMSRILYLAVTAMLASLLALYPAMSGIVLNPFVETPTVHLLTVGVSTYVDPQLPALQTPEPDARLLSAVFSSIGKRSKLASVTELTNETATKSSIIQAYTSILSRAKPDELVIFFFSGHSIQDRITSRVNLLPYDYQIPSGDRSNIAGGIGGIDLLRDIVNIAPADQKLLIIADGCNIGDGSLGPLFDRHPNISILASSKSDELAYESAKSPHTAFVSAIADVLKSARSDLDGDGQLSVEELYIQLYLQMTRSSVGYYSRQHPSLARLHSHRLMLATAEVSPVEVMSIDGLAPPAGTQAEVTISQAPSDSDEISINGRRLEQSDYRITDGKLAFLGPVADAINSGINSLEIGRRKFYLWKIGRSLKAFRDPYKYSRAILVAIDDYDRKGDLLQRGPTGFPQLTGMVNRTRELKSELIKLGFPEIDIIELYNEKATAKNFEDELKSFWVGGVKAETDRLFIYFGGHGEEFQKNNLLVTYDYEQPRRLLTSFQAKDLIERHSRNIQATHVLFALDVCYAGLVFLSSDDEERNKQDLEEGERLAMIERDVTSRARNIIVAGTGDQRALWENGGIFTAALIDGLRGRADPANSGVIQFDQLGIYVKNRVTGFARLNGFRQVPKFVSMDEFGEGRMMFIRSTANK